jgi:hypothetical protein
MTSQEIAEQIAQQNQFFMGQYAMASQIGAPMSFGGGAGLGAGGGTPLPQGAGGGFSYGANPFYGYGAGNRIGGAAMGAASAIPTMGLTGMELFSMTKAGAGIAPLVNPFAAFGAARAGGLGMAGAAGVAGLSMLPAMALQHGVSNIVGGAQQQSMVNTALGQYNHINPQSRTGFGFTRDDASAIGQQVRQLAMMPELMTSMQELTKMMPTLKASGVMQGVRDAFEFNRRFKEAITTIRDISKVIGSTMEEAGAFFQHSARVGFFGRTDQLRNAVQAQVVTGTTGMTQQQFMQLQQGMADLGTATGTGRSTMARAAGNIASTIGLAQQGGVIKQGLLEDLTGKTGGEAVQDASMRMANLSVRLAGSSVGRYMIAGAMEVDEGGKARLNQDVMKRWQEGLISSGELRQRGMKTMSQGKNAIAFEASQSRLAGEFTAAGGVQATYGLMDQLVGQYGSQAPELLMQRYGASEQEAELARNLYQSGTGGSNAAQNLVANMRSRQSSMRENADPRAVMKRVGTAIGNKISQPFQKFGAELWGTITKGVDSFIDDMVGNYVVAASEESQKKFIQAFATKDKKALEDLFGGNTGARRSSGSGPGSTLGALIRLTGPMGASAMAAGPTTMGQDFGSLVRDVRGSSLGAWVSSIGSTGTGRTPENAFSTYSNWVGAKGLDINKDSDVASYNKRLGDIDSGAMFKGMSDDEKAAARYAAEAHRDLMGKDEFRNATEAKKLEMIQQRVASKSMDAFNPFSGEERGLRRGLEALEKRTGMGGVTAAVFAAQATEIDRSARISASAAWGQGSYIDVAAAALNYREADSQLVKHFGANIAQTLKSRPAVRDVLEAWNSATTDKNAIHDAIMKGDVARVEELTKKRLTSSELEAAAQALEVMKKDPSKAKGVLDAFKEASKTKDTVAFAGAIADQATAAGEAAESAARSGNSAFADKMKAVKEAYDRGSKALLQGSVEDRQKAWSDMQESAKSAAELIIKAPEGDREQMVQTASPAVRAAYEGMKGAREIWKHHGRGSMVSASKLAEELHIDVAEVKKVLKGDRGQLTDLAMKELEGVTGRHRSAQIVAGGAEQQQQKDAQNQMVVTLKVIAEAVIAANADKLGKVGEKGSKATELQQQLSGNATPGY